MKKILTVFLAIACSSSFGQVFKVQDLSIGGNVTSTTPIAIGAGGTGRATLNTHGVLVGAGTSPINQITSGNTGQMLIGITGSDPAFGNNPIITGGTITGLSSPIPVASGGTNLSTLPAHSVLLGEGASSVGSATPGTANFSLLSTGASSDPTFQQLTAPMVNYTQGGTGAVTYDAQTKLRSLVTARDYGVISDGATDDSAAINTALASGNTLFPRTNTISNTATTSTSYTWATFGGTFGGTNALDSVFPFAGGAFRVAGSAGNNAIIGMAYNNTAANTAVFPTGTTGYGRVNNSGNQVFGLFGRADMYASGVATNEFNSFNFAGAPSSLLPPNRSFGTATINPIAVTVATGGTSPSSIGIHFAREGSQPQPMLTGIYTDPNSITSNGIVVGADASNGPGTSAEFQNVGTGVNLNLVTTGTAIGSNHVLQIMNNLRSVQAFWSQNGDINTNGRIYPNSLNGIAGTGSNDSAISGSIGEYPSPTNLSAVSLSNGVSANVASMPLTAGDYDASCTASFVPAGTTIVVTENVGISTTSANFGPLGSTTSFNIVHTAGNGDTLTSPTSRISLASSGTAYCVVNSQFSTSTQTANGFIRTRRVR